MSDRFNSNEEKKTITQLLAPELGGIVPDSPVEALFPPFYKQGKDTMKATEFAKLLVNMGMVTYKPRAIPDLVETDVNGMINPDAQELVDAYGGKALLPVGTREFLPQYTPRHFSNDYDLKLYKQIIYQWLEANDLGLYEPMMKELSLIPKLFVFSSGTYEGQIARLKAMYQVNQGLAGKRKPKPVTKMLSPEFLKNSGSALEAVAKIMEFYLPLNTVEDFMDGGFPGLLYKPSYYISFDANDPFDYLPKIGQNKMAGLPYVGKTKTETILPALVLADSFVGQVSALIASSTPEGNNQMQGYNVPHAQTTLGNNEMRKRLEELLNDFWYLGAGQLFPKAERYEKEQLTTKTRNIFATSFPMHMICSLISNPVMELSPNTIHGDTPSLYAFSPFHGGMDTFVRKMYDANETTSWIYADNWYVLYLNSDGTKDYYSIDQEKAEAQVSMEDIQAVGYYLLSRGHITRDGEPAFNLTWLYLATTLIPALLIDPTVLLMNQQFLQRGMGSGISWTFVINHLRSAVIDYKWRVMGKPQPGTKEFEMKVLVPCGCNLKIEYVGKDIISQLEKLKTDTPEQGYLQEVDITVPSKKPVPYVKMDLLGWGAAYSNLADMFIPVLEDERMFKSLLLPQKDERHDYADKPWQRYTYQVARCEAMRMVGAWRYQPIDAALRVHAEEARSKLLKMNKLTRQDLEDAFRMTEFGSELNLDGVNLVKAVGHEELILLNVPKETAADLRKMEILNPNRPRWAPNLVEPIPRAVKIPGASVMANMKIEDLLINKGLLGSRLDPKEMSDFIHSKEYAEAVMELASMKNFLRNKTELPSLRPTRENVVEYVANPYVGNKLHHEHMETGTTKEKTGSGPSTSAPLRLSKNQRRKQNRLERGELVEQLVEGVTARPIPQLRDSTFISKRVVKPEDLVPTPKATNVPAMAGEGETQPKPVVPSRKVPPPVVQRQAMPVKPEKLKISEIIALDDPVRIAQYLSSYYSFYGAQEMFKIVLKNLGPEKQAAVREEIEETRGPNTVTAMFGT